MGRCAKECTKKLGALLGPATWGAKGGVLSRRFKSGTRVTLGSATPRNDSADSLGFVVADINNVADEVGAKFPTVYLAGKVANAHQCGLLCAKNATCLSYTWCGPTKGRTHRIVSFGATLCGTQ